MKRRATSPQSQVCRQAFAKPRPLPADDSRIGTTDADMDARSLETETNFNWKLRLAGGPKRQNVDEELTVIRPDSESIRVGGGAREISSQNFYESSHFFIDQLKAGLCQPKADGWFEVKEQELQEESEAKEASGSLEQSKTPSGETKAGRWTKEEHARFLEGLKLFGKDWPKLSEYIGNRSVKTVMSHAQKFLVKLVKFLNHEGPISEMTQEEAEYFHGVLNKKGHRFANLWSEREQEIEALKAKGAIFWVQKIQRRKRRTKLEATSALQDEPMEPSSQEERAEEAGENAEELCYEKQTYEKSAYEQWRDQIIGESEEQRSFHLSLGHSIKVLTEPTQQGNTLTFKSVFKKCDDDPKAENDSDNDSGTSLSKRYIRKFDILEGNYGMKDEAMFVKYRTRMREAFHALADLNEGEGAEIIVRFANGVECNLLKSFPLQSVLSQITLSSPTLQMLFPTHPNLSIFISKLMVRKMDDGELLLMEQPSYPMWDYFATLSNDELDSLLDEKVEFYYSDRRPHRLA